MNILKRLAILVCLLFSINVSAANFWQQLAKNNPNRIEAINIVIWLVNNPQVANDTPDMKPFISLLGYAINNCPPRSKDWQDILDLIDSMIQQPSSINFNDLIENRDACIDLLRKRITFFTDEKNTPGIEQIDFLKATHKNQ